MRRLNEVVELTRNCDIGKSGERAVVTSVGTGPLAHMTLVFANREHGREVHTGADYKFLRSV